LVVALVLLALSPAPATAAPKTVKIGAALSMTGAAAVYGAAQKNGILLAVDYVNKGGTLGDVALEAVIEDDGSAKEQAISVYQRLINQYKVAVIIGPTLSTMATAADPIAQMAHVPVVAVSNTAPTGITDIGDYIWRVSLTEKQVIPGAFKNARGKLGFKTAAVLYGNDDVFTKAGYDVMKVTLDEQAIRVLNTQTFAKADRDFNPQLTALMGAHPEVLVISALADNAATIVAQARQLGFAGPILGGNGFNSPAFIKNAGAAAEGVVVGTSWNSESNAPANVAFKTAMAGRGAAADQFAAQAYTGVLVIAEAIRRQGKQAGRDDIKAGLAKVRDLDTPLGRFSFLPSRDGQHEPTTQVVKNGRFQALE
jgi:branched-chain amino acid transport system substrate-binding protein